jgi:AcrR family transcriptional regulator
VALRSFSERGYEGTTTAGVAREAGVTQPLVHHHFGSKEGLWRAAMHGLFSELRMFTALDRSLPPTRALLEVVEGFVRLSAARPELTRIIAREGATRGPRLTYLIDTYLGPQLRTCSTWPAWPARRWGSTPPPTAPVKSSWPSSSRSSRGASCATKATLESKGMTAR